MSPVYPSGALLGAYTVNSTSILGSLHCGSKREWWDLIRPVLVFGKLRFIIMGISYVVETSYCSLHDMNSLSTAAQRTHCNDLWSAEKEGLKMWSHASGCLRRVADPIMSVWLIFSACSYFLKSAGQGIALQLSQSWVPSMAEEPLWIESVIFPGPFEAVSHVQRTRSR
jgi:hypothetical protein